MPPAAGTATGSYLKLERRVGDFATAGVAVALERSDGTVTRAGIALTGVGPATIHATDAEDALVGEAADRGDRSSSRPRRAAEAAQPRSDHRGSADYKRHVVARSCAAAWHGPGGGGMTSFAAREITPGADDEYRITVTVNGERRVVEVEPRLLLAHLLREGLGLTGTHLGCDTTNCGACTVLVDGTPVKSCTMLAVQADGRAGHHRRGARHGRRAATRCRRASPSSTACSAASAPPG